MNKTLSKVRLRFYYSTYSTSGGLEDPMERIALDIMGPLPTTDNGNKCILVIADYFTVVEAYSHTKRKGRNRELVDEFIFVRKKFI